MEFKQLRRVAIFSHVRPDGDTLGAMFSLRAVFLNLGAEVDCFCDGALPTSLAFLDADGCLNRRTLTSYEACIAVDCADPERMGSYAPLFASGRRTYNIDHHGTNPGFADENIVRSSASTCEIVFDLLEEAEIPLDARIAAALYTGMLTDTGSFSQSNTTPHTHFTAGKLLAHGIEVEWLHHHLMKEMSRAKLLLIADRAGAMRFYEEERIALIVADIADLERFGLTQADTEGLVNYALNVTGVRIAVCMTQYAADQYKISLRSRKGVDVAAVASAFGGGGHVQAAGCSLRGLKEEIVERVIRQCGFALGE